MTDELDNPWHIPEPRSAKEWIELIRRRLESDEERQAS